MSVAEIIHEIDTLPVPEQWRVLEHTRHLLEPEDDAILPDETLLQSAQQQGRAWEEAFGAY